MMHVRIHHNVALVATILGLANFATANNNNNNNVHNIEQQQPQQQSNKTRLDFGVFLGHQSNESMPDHKDDDYFCVINILPKSSDSTKFRYDDKLYKLNNLLEYNLCNTPSLMTLRNTSPGYHLFNFSTCSATMQLANFATFFPNSRGILFSSTCDLNLTKFNLTSEYVAEQKFTITVITDWSVKRLIQFDQLQLLQSRKSSFSLVSVLIFSIAVFAVVVGSYWGGELRYAIYLDSQRRAANKKLIKRDSNDLNSSKKPQNQEAFAELTALSVAFAVVVTICVLLALYFFYKYIVYFFIFIFVTFSSVSLFACVYYFLARILPPSFIAPSFTSVPFLCCKSFTVKYISLLILPLAVSMPIIWFCVRHTSENAWILQDILCTCFCIFQLRTLRLPSFKICFILLTALFVYDIFFVFITPLFTKNGVSIMEYVATGGVSNRGSIFESRCPGERAEVLPLAIRAPRNVFLPSDPHVPDVFCFSGGYSLLGLGDIIIPGIMVAYCYAFDLIHEVPYRPYFLASSISYAIGLILSYIALMTMNIAQPALLYLVPCTIMAVLIVSLYRSELRQFWVGPEQSMKSIAEGSAELVVEESVDTAETVPISAKN